MDRKKLHDLIDDFKRYAIVLLAVSTFLYIGLFIPESHMNLSQQEEYVLLSATTVLLFSSVICFKQSLKYRKQLEELEDE